MTWRPSGVGGRVALAAVALLAAGLLVVGVVAPPERCPSVTTDELRASATEAVDWFVRNQRADGRWLYEYDADRDEATPAYNAVRHAGAIMGLYQAGAAGIDGALESADEGLEWAIGRLGADDGTTGLTFQGTTPAGTAALLLSGLVERRLLSDDPVHDDLMQGLGQFLAAQTEPSGAVLAYYDTGVDAPQAGEYSKYYTGETYWALARLGRLFPDGPWTDAADRIGGYVAARRDAAEDFQFPLPDHWAAYGLAETVADGGRALTADEIAYAREQAGLFGAQVRWVSQRHGPWGVVVRGPHVPRGGGYGVVGEALTGLWRVAGVEPEMDELRAPLGSRAECIAGLAVTAQVDAAEAEEYAVPERVRGAWFRDGITRMDDQQHALSAVLRTEAIVEARSDGYAREAAPSAWLWLVALVAAFNPLRAALGLPRPGRTRRQVAEVAALGGLVGGAAAAVLGFVGAWLLDAADVSDPALRIAAGVVAVIVGTAGLIRRPPSPEPALGGWRAALVPVAIPLVAGPALVVLAAGTVADGAVLALVGAIVGGIGLLTLVAWADGTEGIGGRVTMWGARLVAAALVATAVLLVIDGVLAV